MPYTLKDNRQYLTHPDDAVLEEDGAEVPYEVEHEERFEEEKQIEAEEELGLKLDLFDDFPEPCPED